MIDMEQVKQAHLYGTVGGSYQTDTTPNKYIPNDIPLDMFLIIKIAVQQILLRRAYKEI